MRRSSRDDYPFHASFDPLPGLLLPDEHAEMLAILDEIDQLRRLSELLAAALFIRGVEAKDCDALDEWMRL